MNRSEYALQLRVSLVEALAPDGRCARCDQRFELEDLEVDHADGRTWYGRALNFLDRIRRQWRERDEGIQLRALCKSCNASDGSRRFRGRHRDDQAIRRRGTGQYRGIDRPDSPAENRPTRGHRKCRFPVRKRGFGMDHRAGHRLHRRLRAVVARTIPPSRLKSRT